MDEATQHTGPDQQQVTVEQLCVTQRTATPVVQLSQRCSQTQSQQQQEATYAETPCRTDTNPKGPVTISDAVSHPIMNAESPRDREEMSSQ
jgi:hypothetical protein